MSSTIAGPAGKQQLPGFEHALVSDVMGVGVITCEPSAPLRLVAGIMASERVHCVVVAPGTDQEAGPWSIVSDLDLVRAVSGSGFDGRSAADAAVSEYLTVVPGEKLERAAQMMMEHDLTHLVVVDPADGRPVGVISTLDLAAVLAWGGV